MSYTPPGYPGQPQQPASPDGRWWWDGSRWRPNAANPFDPAQNATDDSPSPRQPPADAIRFTPGPPGVPNPYVPPRQNEPTPPDEPDVRFLLASQPRSWWTPRRFVLLLAGIVLAILLGIGLLFWLSVDAYQKQRDDVGPGSTPQVTTQERGSLPS